MPKPHTASEIRSASRRLFDGKFGYLENYNRMYVRIDGKFVPIGYQLNFRNRFRKKDRWITEKTSQIVTDQDLFS